MPPAGRYEAMEVPVFRGHLEPISAKWAGTAEDLSHCSKFRARVGGRHAEKSTRTSFRRPGDCKIAVRGRGEGASQRVFPRGHEVAGGTLFEG